MAEESGGAGREAVGAGLEHDDEVADLRSGQLDLVAEQVERRAQAADDARLFFPIYDVLLNVAYM